MLRPDSDFPMLSLSMKSMSPSRSLPSLLLVLPESELEPVEVTEAVDSLPLILGLASVVLLLLGEDIWMGLYGALVYMHKGVNDKSRFQVN